jgi:hypothetical protein
MRKYGIIRPSFWTDTVERFKGNADAIAIACYLMSSPHSNMIGLYYLPIPYAVYDTGLGEESIRKALQTLETADFAFYDEGVVFIPSMAEHQCGESLHPQDKIIPAIVSELEKVSHEKFRSAFVSRYHEVFHLEKAMNRKKAPNRSKVREGLRLRVLERDGFACRYCHRFDVPLEVDHVIPVAKGGKTEFDNLVASCEECNRGKAVKAFEVLPTVEKGFEGLPAAKKGYVPDPVPEDKRGPGREDDGKRRPPVSKGPREAAPIGELIRMYQKEIQRK